MVILSPNVGYHFLVIIFISKELTSKLLSINIEHLFTYRIILRLEFHTKTFATFCS